MSPVCATHAELEVWLGSVRNTDCAVFPSCSLGMVFSCSQAFPFSGALPSLTILIVSTTSRAHMDQHRCFLLRRCFPISSRLHTLPFWSHSTLSPVEVNCKNGVNRFVFVRAPLFFCSLREKLRPVVSGFQLKNEENDLLRGPPNTSDGVGVFGRLFIQPLTSSLHSDDTRCS